MVTTKPSPAKLTDRRFIVVETASNGFHGHFLDYSRSVLKSALQMGYEPFLLANVDFPEDLVPREIVARRVFTQDWLVQRREPTGISNSYKFYKELKEGLKGLRTGLQDILFMHTLSVFEIDGFRLLVSDEPEGEIPYICLVFRDDLDSHPLLAEKMARLYQWDSLGRVCFLTDSDDLEEQFVRRVGVPFSPVPIPVPITRHRKPPRLHCDVGRKIRFVYLGGCRSEKGYGLIYPALEKNFRLIQDRKIEVVIQSYLNPYDPSDLNPMERARSRLADLNRRSGGGVSLIYDALTPDEYTNLLHSADVVMLPYLSAAYGRRTSGVFAEALAAGKLILSSRWPWIEKQMQRYPCGVLMRSCSAESLAAAMREAVSRYVELSPKQEIVQSWCNYHTSDNLVSTIVSSVEEKKRTSRSNANHSQSEMRARYVEILDEMAREINTLKLRLNPDGTLVTSPWIEMLLHYSSVLRIKAPGFHGLLRTLISRGLFPKNKLESRPQKR